MTTPRDCERLLDAASEREIILTETVARLRSHIDALMRGWEQYVDTDDLDQMAAAYGAVSRQIGVRNSRLDRGAS